MYKQQKAALINVNCGGVALPRNLLCPASRPRGNEAGGLDTHPYISMGSGAAGL